MKKTPMMRYPSSDTIKHFRDEHGAETEVRLNEDGTLDEVVADGFHLEQMDDDAWWLWINGVHVNLVSSSPITASYEPDVTTPFTRTGETP